MFLPKIQSIFYSFLLRISSYRISLPIVQLPYYFYFHKSLTPPSIKLFALRILNLCYRTALEDDSFHISFMRCIICLFTTLKRVCITCSPLIGTSYSFTLNLSTQYHVFLVHEHISLYLPRLVLPLLHSNLLQEVLITILIFQICMYIELHQWTLSYKIFHKTLNTILWLDAYRHMHMIRH